MRSRALLAAALTALGLLTLPTAQAASAPKPLGLTCVPQADKVRFCAGNGTTDRVPSFDGTPLDVDVTLPPSGSGPFPTIVMLHGWGNDKTGFESTDLAGNGYNAGAGVYAAPTYHYNNDFYARRGYAVLTYSARGKGQSCGGGGAPRAQLQTGPCANGFIRLADTRYEVRDTQYLLGLLADQRFVRQDAIGVTGISYGGGQSLELAYLKNRVVCAGGATAAADPCKGKADGAMLPWRSPKGTPMSVAAAHPRWFWSDLVSALVPNGRFLDFGPSTADLSRKPVGVVIASFLNGLLATGSAGGYVVAPQAPGSSLAPWDLHNYGAVLDAGEPYGADASRILDEIVTRHQGHGIAGTPAPLLLESGWNDQLFPAAQSLRTYDSLRARDPRADVTMMLGDVGHSAGSNKLTVNAAFNDQTAAFFDRHLLGKGATRPRGSVVAYTTTCPAAAPDGGPFAAPSWNALHPKAVVFGLAAPQTILAPVGGASVSPQLDPIANSDSCKTVRAADGPGTAVYTLPSKGFTLLGLPTIKTTVATTGTGGQLDGRLWDVAPDGTQLLVSRGGYRLLDNQAGPVVFQLHGNGYRFAPGHTVKLELTGSDAPYFRPSNSPFSVTVSGTTLSLPVAAGAPNGQPLRANAFLQR
ncbi:MAG: CocE/NonD family hydrolase [Mycobacteriales bacterium]